MRARCNWRPNSGLFRACLFLSGSPPCAVEDEEAARLSIGKGVDWCCCKSFYALVINFKGYSCVPLAIIAFVSDCAHIEFFADMGVVALW